MNICLLFFQTTPHAVSPTSTGDLVPQLSNRYTVSATPHISITPAVDEEDAEELATPIRAIKGVQKAIIDSLSPIPRKKSAASAKSEVPASIGTGSDIESGPEEPEKTYLFGIKNKAHAQQVAIMALLLSTVDDKGEANHPNLDESGK